MIPSVAMRWAFGPAAAEEKLAADCADATNVPRRRKIADGFWFVSLVRRVGGGGSLSYAGK